MGQPAIPPLTPSAAPQMVEARVIDIDHVDRDPSMPYDVARPGVRVSLLPEDLAQPPMLGALELDPYFAPEADEDEVHLRERVERQRQHQRQKTIMSKRLVLRRIVHPQFRNAERARVIAELASGPVGEGLFRPSSQGPDSIVLTWKADDGVYSHLSPWPAACAPASPRRSARAC